MADIILVLDQTPIQGYDQRVTASQALPDQDLSGDSSSTTVAEGGIKPTKLAISLKIRFTDQAQLQSLVNLSRAMGGAGSRQIYQILNQTAKAYNVRQVRFTEQVRAAELADEQAWQVSFTLQEHHSVPERTEARQDASATGTATEATPSSQSAQSTQNTPEQVYTGVEYWLNQADQALAPDEDE